MIDERGHWVVAESWQEVHHKIESFARLRLNHLDLGILDPDLVFEPLSRVRLAVAKNHHPRGDLAHKSEQFIAVGVRGKIKIAHLATTLEFAGRRAEQELSSGLARL
jgi:hypothetical protein